MTKPLRVALVGAAGRMGLEIVRAAHNRDDIVIAFAIERNDSSLIGHDSGTLAGIGHIDVPIGCDLNTSAMASDVIVDLSRPDATKHIVQSALQSGKPLVCGTTGLDADTMETIRFASKSIPLLYTANLSPGIAILSSLLKQATLLLAGAYDIEIVDFHHRNKSDAPSGTAMFLAGIIAKEMGLEQDDLLCFERRGDNSKRSERQIGMHSLRGGSVFGEHSIVFAGEGERIELTHRAESRSLFANGALRAASFIGSARPGLYGMSDVLVSHRREQH